MERVWAKWYPLNLPRPQWLKPGAVVRCDVLDRRSGRLYRILKTRHSSVCYSGTMVLIQKLQPPFYKVGKEVDMAHCTFVYTGPEPIPP